MESKNNNGTPAKPVLSEVEGAGVQSEKLDSRFRGNDKYYFRNRN